MSEPTGPVRLVARQLGGQLLAVVGVATVVAVVFGLAGWGTPNSPSGLRTTGLGGIGGPTTPAPTAAHPTSTAPTTAPASPTSPPATTVTTATTPARPKVDVYNETAPRGTANIVAKGLRTVGWKIGRISDFRGTVSATTVYYPPGLKTQARDLARDVGGNPRVLPGFRTLSSTRLSIVLVG